MKKKVVMKIAGLQKVSTVDYPMEICCVVFLWGCNFRCGFCYNPDLVIKKCKGAFSEDYILNFLSKRVGKLDAVCISGGEPLMTLDFDFVRKIKEMGFKIKLDTNGSFPERLQEMIDLSLVDYIAMDVKGARKDYKKIVDVSVDMKKIEDSIKIVNGFGNRKHVAGGLLTGSEFRTTVVEGLHNFENLIEMGKWMRGICGENPKRIFLQGFKRNKEGMINDEFIEKSDFLEKDLIFLKGELGNLFDEVGIRY